ncbi:metal ABC transporter solute-binding protein, Zn/Mn family [Gymnodinialimonas ceratoperidinii]|uniref:Zinc ABC transporter substrate-binding protein n=1 Tax=Gymnodinialimonas ceratoperidinii TaxID=2856823 RepID=A0A8F6Y9S0_9RHOB|nr:zinc ABC transporter substrate-binding protein [Gymnodinialimonas ceratoperidinii]QXT38181.1 zinc ABC transporter substrate-binding protein [Gymnodinialimonas ceratoperidinii]
MRFAFTALALTLSAAAPAQAELSIVATTGMIADTARQVGGDLVSVQALMGPGVDPHAYRQTRSDIVSTARADIVLWHGLYLEAQMEEFLLELAETNTVIPVAESLPRENLLSSADYPDRFDPHVWMDPSIWADVVQTIEGVLTDALPDSAEVIAANTDALEAEIEALTAYSAEVLGSVPEASRVLLTAHDAFNYFGEAYGFEVIGIQGISTESEAGLQRVGELVDMLVTRNIGAVFVESSVSDRNIRALIEGAAARGHEVTIGGELYSDAMGEDGTYEGTWIGMIDHNVTTIARALGGDAPEGGMQGLLE